MRQYGEREIAEAAYRMEYLQDKIAYLRKEIRFKLCLLVVLMISIGLNLINLFLK